MENLIAILQTTRTHYTAEDAAIRTLTVGEVIRALEENFDEDMPLVFSNDNGYTYGTISTVLFDTEEIDTEEE